MRYTRIDPYGSFGSMADDFVYFQTNARLVRANPWTGPTGTTFRHPFRNALRRLCDNYSRMQSEHPGHDWAGERSKNDHYHLVLLLKDINNLPDENEEFPLPRIRAAPSPPLRPRVPPAASRRVSAPRGAACPSNRKLRA